jgi:hypothetical protein
MYGSIERKSRIELPLMPPKKLTAAERLVQEQMLAMLEWASDNPTKWHPIGKLDATRKAAELLAKRGVIEIWPETGLYRLKPTRTKGKP